MAVRDYRELTVWQEAMNLVTLIYQHTRAFPKFGAVIRLLNGLMSSPDAKIN